MLIPWYALFHQMSWQLNETDTNIILELHIKCIKVGLNLLFPGESRGETRYQTKYHESRPQVLESKFWVWF